MKIILTGSTGLVGGEVLRQALAHPSITEAVVLARRQVTDPAVANNPKLRTVIHSDFEHYSDETMAQLKGASGCVWALGDARNMNEAYQMKTRRDWPFASAEAFATKAAPPDTPFRFVLTSSFLTEHDQQRSLWFLGRMRKVGGQVDLGFVDLPEIFANLECFVTRPAVVLNVSRTLVNRVASLVMPSVGVDELAAVMLDAAVNGRKDGKKFFENKELREMGRELLAKSKGQAEE